MMHSEQDFSRSASGKPTDSKAILVSSLDLRRQKLLNHLSNFGEGVNRQRRKLKVQMFRSQTPPELFLV